MLNAVLFVIFGVVVFWLLGAIFEGIEKWSPNGERFTKPIDERWPMKEQKALDK